MLYSYFCSLQIARNTYTLDSYKRPSVAAAAGIGAAIAAFRDGSAAPQATGITLRDAVLGGRFPGEPADVIRSANRALAGDRPRVALAVRSSATAEAALATTVA